MHPWIQRLGRLNVSRSKAKGPAPNKPLLVLAILDLAEDGLIPADGTVARDAQLNLRFREYSPICAARRGNRIDLDLPWEHLASDGLYVKGVRPSFPPKTGNDGLTPSVKLDTEFHRAIQDPAFRLAARKVLIAAYFPPDEQVALYAACGITPPSSEEIAKVREDQDLYRAQVRKGRSARFAAQVISGHAFTCALTGYRLTTAGSFNLLEAAHIQAHAKHGPDEPENGLALTPTAHELFDAGLWTIDASLRVVIAREAFHETLLPDSPHFSLRALHGRPLFLAGRLRPAEPYLAWHRTTAFAG